MAEISKNSLELTIVAGFLCLAAAWQSQVAVTRGASESVERTPSPAKTRLSTRSELPEEERGDQVSRSIARSAGLLTNRQIGWIVRDFTTAGIHLPNRAATREDYLEQRKAQDRWYRDALAEGLCLDETQSAQLTGSLGKLFYKSAAEFQQLRDRSSGKIQINGEWVPFTGVAPPEILIGKYTGMTFFDERNPFLPGNLCSLPSGLKHDFGPPIVSVVLAGPVFVVDQLDQEIPWIDTTSPFDKARWKSCLLGVLLPACGEAVPQRAEAQKSLLAFLRTLNPARFKLLILFYPEIVPAIQSELDWAEN